MRYSPDRIKEMKDELFDLKVMILQDEGCMLDTASAIASDELDAKTDAEIIDLYEQAIYENN